MAAATSWTHEQVTAAFRRMPELESLLLKGVEDTGERLGEGAFGVVRKLRVAGATFCAGKTIHQALTGNDDKGAKNVVFNFLKECKMMADLRHPNIVQFIGVCLLRGSNIPILVMELLTDCLHHFILTRKNIPIGMKQSLLMDVASALVFLHSREPQIIHRDLTAKNVLVDERSMKAKVGDLGNSRFTRKSTSSLTSMPGNLLYMPPEAVGPDPDYCNKLDIFSFGHLSLFTLTQEFPDKLLAPTYNSPKDGGKLISRTEVERRGPYIDRLKSSHSKEHLPLVTLIKMCLDNVPNRRPTAMQILQRFEELNSDYDDVRPFQQQFAMAEMLTQKDQEIQHLRRKLQQKETELELVGEREVMSGPLEKFSPRNIMRKWKSYTFKLSDSHLRFFNSWIRKPRGEILLSAVSRVYIPHRSGRLQGDKHYFEVHFNGRDSPWILSAYSTGERKDWMAAIRACQKPKMTANAAYGMVPLTAGMDTPDTIAETEKEHDYETIAPLQSPLAPLPAKEKPTLPHRPEDLKRRPAPDQSDVTDEEKRRKPKPPMESLAPIKEVTTPTYDKTVATLNRRATKFTPNQLSHLITMLQQTQQEAVGGPESGDEKKDAGGKEPLIRVEDKDSDPSSDSNKVLPYYINYSSLLEADNSPQEKQATFPRSTTKSPYYVNYLDVCDRRGRPSSVKNHGDSEHRPRSVSPTGRDSPYFTFSNMMGGVSRENSHSQSHLDLRDMGTQDGTGKGLRKPAPFPKPSSPSPYLVPLPSSHGKQRETLKHMLKQSKQAPESLLITEDDTPEEYVSRPQWAKANTKRPGPNTLAAMHRRRIYIMPKLLTKVVSLGEGRYGKVYKAEMLIKYGANIKVVVKSVNRITTELQKEVTVMSEVVHPNIVRLYGLINEGVMKPAIVMEHLPNGDLKTFLSRNERDNLQLMKYMVDVAIGMHYLSEKGIIHRDLAARNVLVDTNELCKVADFGLVREVPSESTLFAPESRGPSTIRWMAPESISKQVVSPASDIWSFGILQWEMFNAKKLYPYPALHNEEVVEKVTSGYPMPTPRRAPQIVVRIMKACWNSEPSRRPSFLLIANLLTSHMMGDDD